MSALRQLFLVGAALSVTFPHPACARSGVPVGLSGVKSIAIELSIGGGLDVEPGIALRLFDGDLRRADAFEQAIADLACEKLTKAGFEAFVAPFGTRPEREFDASLQLTFFGRPVGPHQKAPQDVYLVEAEAWRQEAGGECEDQPRLSDWTRTVIGVTADETLEHELRRIVSAMLDDLIAHTTP